MVSAEGHSERSGTGNRVFSKFIKENLNTGLRQNQLRIFLQKNASLTIIKGNALTVVRFCRYDRHSKFRMEKGGSYYEN